jgi:hypothetical protein
VDLDFQIRVYDYAVDEQPNEPLAGGEIRSAQGGTDLLNEIREIRANYAAGLLVVKSSLRLPRRIEQNRLAALDLRAPAKQLVNIDAASLVGVHKTLHLSVVSLNLATQPIQLGLERLAGRFDIESSVVCNSLGIGHERLQVTPNNVVQHLGFQRLQRALRCRVTIAGGL